MQNSAKQVEGMVRMKMEQREYIILCLEDTNDWSNATTRRLVMQVCTGFVFTVYLHQICKTCSMTACMYHFGCTATENTQCLCQQFLVLLLLCLNHRHAL